MAGSGSGYARNWKKWVGIYLAVGVVVYLVVFLLFLNNGGGGGGFHY